MIVFGKNPDAYNFSLICCKISTMCGNIGKAISTALLIPIVTNSAMRIPLKVPLKDNPLKIFHVFSQSLELVMLKWVHGISGKEMNFLIMNYLIRND